MGEGGGDQGIDKAQTISRNCGMTHSRGKTEFNCRYFIMSFHTQIHTKKFDKNGFHTLQGTMSHRPLTNASSLKIAAAYLNPRKIFLCNSMNHRIKILILVPQIT